MSTLFVWKEQLQTIYSKYSAIIDRVLQFILGLLVFGLINKNVGFMGAASSLFVTFGLSVICTFLPLVVMTFLAAGLLLLHFYSLSLSVAIVSAMIFVVMYIFYFRFTPGKAWLVLLTPIAFALKIPYAIPIAFGLVGMPVCIIPAACGTIVYYMIYYVKTSSAALKSSGTEALMEGLSAFTKQVLQNKEMWVMVISFTVALILVYTIKTKAIDHAWKIAIAVGVIADIVMVVVGGIMLGVTPSYITIIIGSVAAAVIGLALELLLFSVDYTKIQQLQFEDDEYYYYVKAIPKISVSAPEKTVTKINERQDTEVIDSAKVEKEAKKTRLRKKKRISDDEWEDERTDEKLLKQSLDKELGMDKNQ